MNRETAKPTSNCESHGLRDDGLLPDDKQIAARYIQWKSLMDKYDKLCLTDDQGLPIDDVLGIYHFGETGAEKMLSTTDEALECSDDDDATKQENSKDYTALQKHLKTAVKHRTAEWKNNGMEQIFNSNFSFSVDYVQKWMEQCELGTGRQVTQERETRFTEYNGNGQVDVTHRENVSVRNEAERKQLTAEQSSNYEYSDNDRRRVVVHQIEKTTISSYLTVDPNDTNGNSQRTVLTLPLDSFFGNITSFTPFKNTTAIEQLRSAGRERREMQPQKSRKINLPASGSETLSKLLESSLKLVPKVRVENLLYKKPQQTATRVRFKPVKKVQMRRKVFDTSSSSESSSSSCSSSSTTSSEESNSSNETHKPPKPAQIFETVQPKKNPARTREQSILNQTSSSTCSSTSDVSSASSSTSFKKITGKGVSLTNGTKKASPPAAANRSDTRHAETRQHYPMPTNYRQMLSVNGRCRYKTDGTVIYRPKSNHQELARSADKILIKRQDLDLTGIKSSLRRKKFDNFSRRMHPNSVLVYYMSDSDAEVENVIRVDSDEKDTSDDDDDPILCYKPDLCVLTFFNDEVQKS